MIGRDQCLQGLAGDLPQALACDQHLGAELFGQTGGNAHHHAAGDNGQHVRRAMVAQGELDVGEIDDMHSQPAGIGSQDLGQREHLFPRPVAGIGKSMEVDRVELHAARSHHVAGHRAVDAA